MPSRAATTRPCTASSNPQHAFPLCTTAAPQQTLPATRRVGYCGRPAANIPRQESGCRREDDLTSVNAASINAGCDMTSSAPVTSVLGPSEAKLVWAL